jgi:predicted membrane protein
MKAQLSRFIMGLAIVAIGVGFLLGNFDILNFKDLAKDWWPLVVVLVGILIFINDIKNYLWALIVTGFGVLLELRQLGVADINPWQVFWPAVIILVGLSIIFNRAVGHHKISKSERDDLSAILGGHDQKNTSDDFKGSKLTAVMGGIKLDLRKATIKKEATIEIFSFWGGIELSVPDNVIVKNRISCIAGGVEDKTEQPKEKNAPILYITGDVMMAGVEIKN